MAVRKQSKREPELGVASTQSFPRGRFLANRCRSCARILSLGQPGSVLSTRQMQLMATVYTRRAPQDINLPERKILVEHRAKQPSVIILLRRMYHLLINALCGADQHLIPHSANQASHQTAIFFSLQGSPTGDVSVIAISTLKARIHCSRPSCVRWVR